MFEEDDSARLKEFIRLATPLLRFCAKHLGKQDDLAVMWETGELQAPDGEKYAWLVTVTNGGANQLLEQLAAAMACEDEQDDVPDAKDLN